jgi:hypothetical protein
MIFMTVRNQDAAEIAHAFGDICDVRNDEVDSALVLLRELAARIEHDQVLATLDDRHVLANFANAAKWDHTNPIGPDRSHRRHVMANRRGDHSRGVDRRPGRAALLPSPLMCRVTRLNALRGFLVATWSPDGSPVPALLIGALLRASLLVGSGLLPLLAPRLIRLTSGLWLLVGRRRRLLIGWRRLLCLIFASAPSAFLNLLLA